MRIRRRDFTLFGDTPTRSTELDAGEAIIFANGTHVELDGLHGLAMDRGRSSKRKRVNISCSIIPSAAMTLGWETHQRMAIRQPR